jgi:hypothetical protein
LSESKTKKIAVSLIDGLADIRTKHLPKKGRLYPRHTGEAEVQILSQLTSVSAALPPAKNQGTHRIQGWVDHTAFMDCFGEDKISYTN